MQSLLESYNLPYAVVWMHLDNIQVGVATIGWIWPGGRSLSDFCTEAVACYCFVKKKKYMLEE
jgi:hypothetical protein